MAHWIESEKGWDEWKEQAESNHNTLQVCLKTLRRWLHPITAQVSSFPPGRAWIVLCKPICKKSARTHPPQQQKRESTSSERRGSQGLPGGLGKCVGTWRGNPIPGCWCWCWHRCWDGRMTMGCLPTQGVWASLRHLLMLEKNGNRAPWSPRPSQPCEAIHFSFFPQHHLPKIKWNNPDDQRINIFSFYNQVTINLRAHLNGHIALYLHYS